jgi:hypothetical protein
VMFLLLPFPDMFRIIQYGPRAFLGKDGGCVHLLSPEIA